MGGCLGCAKCREHADTIGCVQSDDALGILEQMVAADGILFASPIYFWGFSAQTKTLIDRSYALVTNYHRPGHTSLLAAKPIGLLVTGAGSYDQNAEGMFAAFDRLVDFYLARKTGEQYIGGCTTPGQLPSTAREQAAALARAMVAHG